MPTELWGCPHDISLCFKVTNQSINNISSNAQVWGGLLRLCLVLVGGWKLLCKQLSIMAGWVGAHKIKMRNAQGMAKPEGHRALGPRSTREVRVASISGMAQPYGLGAHGPVPIQKEKVVEKSMKSKIQMYVASRKPKSPGPGPKFQPKNAKGVKEHCRWGGLLQNNLNLSAKE